MHCNDKVLNIRFVPTDESKSKPNVVKHKGGEKTSHSTLGLLTHSQSVTTEYLNYKERTKTQKMACVEIECFGLCYVLCFVVKFLFTSHDGIMLLMTNPKDKNRYEQRIIVKLDRGVVRWVTVLCSVCISGNRQGIIVLESLESFLPCMIVHKLSFVNARSKIQCLAGVFTSLILFLKGIQPRTRFNGGNVVVCKIIWS